MRFVIIIFMAVSLIVLGCTAKIENSNKGEIKL